MADFTNAKGTVGTVSPENAIAAAWDRLEPILTPQQLRSRFLFGIPLVSKMRDPISGTVQVMTDEILQDYIIRAISLCESDGHFDISPVIRREKVPFDRPTFDSYGYITVKHRPGAYVMQLAVVPADGTVIYKLPMNWLETTNFIRGQLNIIPLNIAMNGGGYVPAQGAGGSLYLSIINMIGWVPAFWQLEYMSGFADNLVPRELNELIGVVAAIEVLSQLAATDADITGRSLGIDGMSQSVSGPGGQKFQTRIEALELKRQKLLGQLRTKINSKFICDWV